jgi:hypothetical protein
LPRWPQTLREKVQDVLEIGWINKFPLLQSIAPCALAARTLARELGPRISDFVYIDFASGSGGPTPYIEADLNRQLREEGKDEVKFVLSDISPHISAWSFATKKSDNLSYIAQSVDATDAPRASKLLKGVAGVQAKKVMRLFSLAFHHFDDDLAAQVLENTVKTSDGFWSVSPSFSAKCTLTVYSIFELQSRNLSSFILVSLLWPLAWVTAPYYFGNSPAHLFFTYLVPLIPFVWVFDGYISILRTRTPEEVDALLQSKLSSRELQKWDIKSGRTCHMWPLGWLYWIIATKTD